MATSFLALLDDITLLLDDVSVMTKVAAKKTAGVLSDDIALNANQVTGFSASRELPVVWAVAKGSAINKAILVPIALLIVAFAPWALTPLLMLGGAYLCYEGVEKLAHKIFHKPDEDLQHHQALRESVMQEPGDLLALEKTKIRGAIATDFILSAEIIAISLGTMQGATFTQQAAALVAISVLMTIGVYGLVAGIVKLDDAGIYLSAASNNIKQTLGRFILWVAPHLMRALSFLGTAAMFLVGGGIIAHGVPIIEQYGQTITQAAGEVAVVGGLFAVIAPHVANLVVGLAVGAVLVVLFKLYSKIVAKPVASTPSAPPR
ncbi:MAG: DUF808 domain-containing protein [Pseudomonadota bacterium]